jgi:L-rhamnose isomerase/sugar isomerase
MDSRQRRSYQVVAEDLATKGVDIHWVEARLRSQRVETPSWGYGNSGTRFRVFPQEGVPRNPQEKLEDAAQVHKHTGICPSVAIHIPWDRTDDMRSLGEYAQSLGMTIGAVNPNLFQEHEYKLGSVCNPDAQVRKKAVEHMLECIEIARDVDSNILSLWLADGTNYPGQDSFIDRRERMLDSLTEVYRAMPETMRLLVEYKFYEPGFYHTDLSDWGTSLLTCQKLGDQAQVLVDLGHHAQGTNVEHIVAILLDEGRLGGFHFNSRKYGDDDLLVGAINPFELFLIYAELAHAEVGQGQQRRCAEHVAYMLDQSHNIEAKIEAMIQSVMNLQEMYARALLVNWTALQEAQHSRDVLKANRVLNDAYATDVRPVCAKVREDLGASADPVGQFHCSGYLAEVANKRTGGAQAGWT